MREDEVESVARICVAAFEEQNKNTGCVLACLWFVECGSSGVSSVMTTAIHLTSSCVRVPANRLIDEYPEGPPVDFFAFSHQHPDIVTVVACDRA